VAVLALKLAQLAVCLRRRGWVQPQMQKQLQLKLLSEAELPVPGLPQWRVLQSAREGQRWSVQVWQ